MKLSLEWLKEYVNLPQDLDPNKLMYDLTMCTVEVEGLVDLSKEFQDIFVGVIKEVKAHPGADRLKIVETDLGQAHGIKDIVCGGSNLSAGMAVVVAVPGAWVNWHGDAEKTQLKLAKIRGVESFGMICAAEEVGLSALYPARDEKEIVDLKDPDAVAGTPVADYLGFNDIIIEIDNKSLTNRPDLWGHYGIARELSAIYGVELKPLPEFDLSAVQSKGALTVKIDCLELCQRFTATVVKGVENIQSPLWLKSRLARVGQRPISFLVDLTNYVMFGVGKPTHAFDLSKINGSQLEIRKAKASEKLLLLDGSELELDSDTLIVADGKSPLGLAGIMGGEASGVSSTTKEIVLESANFTAVNIRRTGKRYDVRSESSARFEKGLDTDLTIKSQEYLLSLLKSVQPQIEVVQFVDEFPVKPESCVINLDLGFIESRIGMSVTKERVVQLLSLLGFQVAGKGENLQIQVPAWRATGDVSLPEDIVEEVARMIGYDNLEFKPIPVAIESALRQNWYHIDQTIRSLLATRAGLQEVVTYPWVSQRLIDACQESNLGAIELAAPPSPEQKKLKTCLVPSLLELVEKNLRFYSEFGLYEISRVFDPQAVTEEFGSNEKLPVQPKILGMVVVGKEPQATFLRLKGVVEGIANALGVDFNFDQELSTAPNWVDSSAAIRVLANNKELGYLGLASRKTLRKAGIERVSVCFAVLSMAGLYQLPESRSKFKPLPKFPEIEYDLAVVFDRKTAWEQIKSLVSKSDPLIREVLFSDEYIGKQISEDKKSIAFKMVLGDPEATLTSEQSQAVAAKVLAKLEKQLGGQLRS